MNALLPSATFAAMLLAAAGCAPGGGASAANPQLFTPQDGGTVYPGYPRTNAATTTTDMLGRTVEAPGMNLGAGGSTTQSLGTQAPGASNTSGGMGGGGH